MDSKELNPILFLWRTGMRFLHRESERLSIDRFASGQGSLSREIQANVQCVLDLFGLSIEKLLNLVNSRAVNRSAGYSQVETYSTEITCRTGHDSKCFLMISQDDLPN